jgi:hypoxanthine phosphoribosyltransferase
VNKLTLPVNPNRYLQQADLIHSQKTVNLAIDLMAKQLNIDYADKHPILLSVMGGAVYFTGQLLPKLTFPLELDYVQATRYHGNTAGSQLEWVVMPKENIKNRSVLILDDILDEGFTLKSITDKCNQQAIKEFKIAVLVEKELNKAKPISADYVGLPVPNRYVFGCGMDIHGWWRNLPAIYALPEGG